MKNLIFKYFLLLFFSMNWVLGFGQILHFEHNDTISGVVIKPYPNCDYYKNKFQPVVNYVIYPLKNPKNKFIIFDHDPYQLKKIVKNIADPSTNIKDLNFASIQKNFHHFNLTKKDTFDFISKETKIVRGSEFTFVIYCVNACVGLDEGDYIVRKALYSIARIDNKNIVKWFRDIYIPSNMAQLNFSKDGNFMIINGSNIIGENKVNHSYLVDLEKKKILHNFFPNSIESLEFSIYCMITEDMSIYINKNNGVNTGVFYFDTKRKELFKVEKNNQNLHDILNESTVSIWNSNTNSLYFYKKIDTKKTKPIANLKLNKLLTFK